MQFYLIGTRTREKIATIEKTSYDEAVEYSKSSEALALTRDEDLVVGYKWEPPEATLAEMPPESQPAATETGLVEYDFYAPFQVPQSEIETALISWLGAPDNWEAKLMATTQAGEVVGPGRGQGGRIFAIVRPKGLGGG